MSIDPSVPKIPARSESAGSLPATTPQTQAPHWLRRAQFFAERYGLGDKLAIALLFAAGLSAVITFAAMAVSSAGQNSRTITIMLAVDFALLMLLGVLLGGRIIKVWKARKRGEPGSRLQVRFVFFFGIIAVVPALLVAVFSSLFLNIGVQGWFSDRVRTAVSESLNVAEAYVREHMQAIAADTAAMALVIDQQAEQLVRNSNLFSDLVIDQTLQRNLSEAMVFRQVGDNRLVIARGGFGLSLADEPIPDISFTQADRGEIAVLTDNSTERVRAMVRLRSLPDTYLYVGRFVDVSVLNHLQTTRRAVEDYERLERERSGIEITFAMIFVIVALLLLFIAVLVGFAVANRLSKPIGELADAAERIRGGDLTARTPENRSSDELGMLARAFNRMTQQIEFQQSELLSTNSQLDERRRFSEAVLEGVSAGVIGLNAEGRIDIANRAASDLLDIDMDAHVGELLHDVIPEFSGLLNRTHGNQTPMISGDIERTRNGHPQTLNVRVAIETTEEGIAGFVVTYDDISELLNAQRQAAWSDVARRIAHEIKNPLTPIQLSAERLKRKYLKQIDDDPETFSNCTDTIVRQVGDIRQMVDEFSNFARMPRAVLEREDLGKICRDALFLQKQAHREIEFTSDLLQDVTVACDRRQIGQAITNLLQNAVDAIEGRPVPEDETPLPPGKVHLEITSTDNHFIVSVTDNGRGLPTENRGRLTEPYMTTRAKGTGLGLAIVKKIMEDHGGRLYLEDAENAGARVRLVFNAAPVTGSGNAPQAAQ
ncbi:HAMP domain-containing protein [Alphaproteobacteria bacterium HT1-32]|nr:HAMP domain-containing protein [Alphaproteobacteria bacterium HT1-32]